MTDRNHSDEPRPPADVASGLADAGLARDGLSWSWNLDLEALVAAVSEPAPWLRGPLLESAQPATPAQPPASTTSPTDPATPETSPAMPVADRAVPDANPPSAGNAAPAGAIHP